MKVDKPITAPSNELRERTYRVSRASSAYNEKKVKHPKPTATIFSIIKIVQDRARCCCCHCISGSRQNRYKAIRTISGTNLPHVNLAEDEAAVVGIIAE